MIHSGLEEDPEISQWEQVWRFSLPVCSRSPQERGQALQAMEKSVVGWINGYGSPQRVSGSGAALIDIIHGGGNGGDVRAARDGGAQVAVYLPTLLRLSLNCPFADVRERCAHILKLVKERSVKIPRSIYVGPSEFIPAEELPALTCLDEQTHVLFIDAFLQNNRLDHLTQVMGFHPQYLECFMRTQQFLLRGDGPLPFHYRHYIAIMAAGRHQCSYLINLHGQEFESQGGDKRWLETGLPQIPKKLRDLYEINKILCHRPWLLTKAHIEKLTKSKDSWTLGELVQAIVIMTQFHALSSFVFGCGINDEVDQDTNHTYEAGQKDGTNGTAPPTQTDSRILPSPLPPVRDQEVGVDTLMKRMKTLSEKHEEFTMEERNKRFQHVESQSMELLSNQRALLGLPAMIPDISQFIEDPAFSYQDFAKRGEVSEIPTFRVQDYSWDDHGYSLVNRLYNDVGNLLDDKFKVAYSLTYYTMGTWKDVDTSRFRRAIWNYIQCMYGIRHDDYDYGEVNQLLERSLKAFIKTVCCFPERLGKADYDGVMREFRHSEKVHVNLMVLEARMQAELLYALRAIMRYMT